MDNRTKYQTNWARPLRSNRTTMGQKALASRSLWRATGMESEDFGKPIIAIVNSFSEFVPGHILLRDVGKIVSDEIRKSGAVAREFNTIAIDDGIAMGHDGMLYSLPSRELIADSMEYVVNAHCADAMVCISNCDKISPGMLIGAMRLNIPAIFVSGGPMEAGRGLDINPTGKLSLSDAMTASANDRLSEEERLMIERNACPTCGSCSGMFSANSMNCLAEALGLALAGNGTLLATHSLRRQLFKRAGRTIVDLTLRHYRDGSNETLPREIASKEAFHNAMAVDIAMGGSTNTILHILALAREAQLDFTLEDINRISSRVPTLCKVAPASDRYFIEDVHQAGGISRILYELRKSGNVATDSITVTGQKIGQVMDEENITDGENGRAKSFYRAAPGGRRTQEPFSQSEFHDELDIDPVNGCIRSAENAYSNDGGLAVLYGNLAPNGAIVKTAAIPEGMQQFSGPARVYDSQEAVCSAILSRKINKGEIIIVRYEGPKGGPGMQEMLYPTSYLKALGLDSHCALITDGRFSGASAGLSIGHVSPEAAAGGLIALIKDGDLVTIDIPKRHLGVALSNMEMARRIQAEEGRKDSAWKPHENRSRKISAALEIYARNVRSASEGASRNFP